LLFVRDQGRWGWNVSSILLILFLFFPNITLSCKATGYTEKRNTFN